jgi:carbonic anhydrase/acetyltransferase-like protein (isoleucine patch superfamily)
MDGCVVLHRALVTQVTVPPSRLIASGTIVDGRLEDHHHSEVPDHMVQFVGSVRDTNLELAAMYGRTDRGRPADGAR